MKYNGNMSTKYSNLNYLHNYNNFTINKNKINTITMYIIYSRLIARSDGSKYYLTFKLK